MIELEGTRVCHSQRNVFGTIVSRSRCLRAVIVKWDDSGACSVAAMSILTPENATDLPKLRAAPIPAGPGSCDWDPRDVEDP